MECEELNIKLCSGCWLTKTNNYKDNFKFTCQIKLYSSLIKHIKLYDIIKDKSLGKDSILYLTHAVKIYSPNRIDELNRILILL